MGPILLLALQASAAQPAPARPMPRIDFDLAKTQPFGPDGGAPFTLWEEACGGADADEIIVCARPGRDREGARYRVGDLLPDPPTAMDELGDALSATVGPFEIGSIRQPDGTRRFGVGMKF